MWHTLQRRRRHHNNGRARELAGPEHSRGPDALDHSSKAGPVQTPSASRPVPTAPCSVHFPDCPIVVLPATRRVLSNRHQPPRTIRHGERPCPGPCRGHLPLTPQNSASLRRLASERRSLHTAPLPPNYLLPASRASEDDLTQLTLLLAGPQGTPYAKGLWRLQLRFPDDYPCSPPKASFRTRIWHPNVEEVGGSVCVDTLKRDWRKELTVRDVLVVSE